MNTKITVVNIGYGRHLFVDQNPERERLKLCAAETEHVHAIVFSQQKDGLEKQLASECLTLYPTQSRSKVSSLHDAYRIAKEIIQSHDGRVIVHAQDPFETGLIGYALKRRFQDKVHFVVQEHGDVFSLPYWRKESVLNQIRFRVGLFILRRADHIRVVSKRIANTLRSLGVKKPIVQLPVAINIKAFQNADARTLPEGTFECVSVARFVPQKNIRLMLEAFDEAYQQNPKLRLRLVGQGPQKQQIQQHISSMFSSENPPVILQDWSDSVPSLMHQAHVYLLTSNYEGWARVLIEALGAKLPIVTTDVGCAGEVVQNGVHGLIVPVNDKAALVQALLRISTDKEFYQSVQQNLEHLDISTIPGTNADRYGQQWMTSFYPQKLDKNRNLNYNS